MLGSPLRPPVAAVAATCGYADQAHLNREFRALAGVTPTGWLGEELRSVSGAAQSGG
jgi:AraC-like DNA-binding protein